MEENLYKAAETEGFFFLAPSLLFSYNSDFKQSFPTLPGAPNLKRLRNSANYSSHLLILH